MPTSNAYEPFFEPLHLAWLRRLFHLTNAKPADPRAQATREELDQSLQFDARCNLLDVATRAINFRFAVAEWLWISFGRCDLASIRQYNNALWQFSDDGRTLAGAYGPHVVAQRDYVLAKLRQDPMTRQAVIEIRRPRAQPHLPGWGWNFNTKDEPCTLSLQFLLRDKKLNCIATMRSSDVWLGVPYDAFTFSMIQNAIAGALNVESGWTSIRFGSSHLYERNLEAANAVVDDYHNDGTGFATITSPRLPGWPPEWLEEVLVNRALPSYIDPSGPWLPWMKYAEVLMAPKVEQARDILKGIL